MEMMKWMTRATIGLMMCLQLAVADAFAQGVNMLLPKPQRLTEQKGALTVRGLRLEVEAEQAAYSQYLSDMRLREGQHYKKVLSVRLVESLPDIPRGHDEAYTLNINDEGIHIQSITHTGAYRALQTLRQLSTPNRPLPLVNITDWPEWRMRGLMHDVGRTFIPFDELKKQIALLAQFKVNVFHWHLTENHAWRLESKAFPQLTSIAATERMPGQYYTINEARELVQWCQKHHVLLIPEIDMPGHSAAFERAMGFGMQTEQGKAALKIILREVIEALDVPYIHLGTDEVEFTDPLFVPEMVAYVRSFGRKVASWNPGWEYKAGEIDLMHLWSWRGKEQPGIPAIDSRLHYTNHYDTFADIVALYNSQIARKPYGTEDLFGAIIAIWNDRYTDRHERVTTDNHLYATMLALAERGWLGGGDGYFDGRTTVLRDRGDDLFRSFEDFERRLLHYKKTSLKNEPIPYVKQTHAAWQIVGGFPNDGDMGRVFPPEESLARDARGAITPPRDLLSYQYKGEKYTAQRVLGSGFYLRHVWGEGTCPGVIANPTPNQTAYAIAWVHAPAKQTVGLMLETQNYSRSENDIPPRLGTWDYKGSQVWLNGKLIAPPVWGNTHTVRSAEIPLDNENASSRKPIPVELRAGWNKIMLKLPVGEFTTPEVRLVKWHFMASFVTLDGLEAVPLRYHY